MSQDKQEIRDELLERGLAWQEKREKQRVERPRSTRKIKESQPRKPWSFSHKRMTRQGRG